MNPFLYILKGIAVGVGISTLIYGYVIAEQRSYVRTLLDEAVDREIAIKEAQMIAIDRDEQLRWIMESLGLYSHWKFEQERYLRPLRHSGPHKQNRQPSSHGQEISPDPP